MLIILTRRRIFYNKMESLFNENIIFIFFFAMIAIYNYSDMKEYQRMAIIYISVYALTFLNIIGIKLAVILLAVSLFCFFEIFTPDDMKFKILVNPIYKIIDFLYISLAQYAFGEMCLALLLLRVQLSNPLNEQDVIFRGASILFVVRALTIVLQQKYVINTFGEMYKVFLDFPVNKVEFNEKLDEACSILTSIEDDLYFEREAYSFLSLEYIIKKLRNKINEGRGKNKIANMLSMGKNFARNVFDESRGYSTIPMQLIRSIGLKKGYNYKYRRKIFEVLYAEMFFKGVKKMLSEEYVSKREHFRKYIIYIYFHTVNTFLGGATFSKFLNAFDMQYDKRNEKDIYDCSNEGIFIACMGLSNRAIRIKEENIDTYLKNITGVKLDADIICQMVNNMMSCPYDGNYLK